MNRTVLYLAVFGMLVLATVASPGTFEPVSYQGRLVDNGVPVDGLYEMFFMLYDAPTNGNFFDFVNLLDVPVVDGYFSVELNFASGRHLLPDQWLEIRVRPNGGVQTILEPRQPIRPVPRSQSADFAIQELAVGSGLTTYRDGHYARVDLDPSFTQRIDTLETLVADQAALIAAYQDQITTLQGQVNALQNDVSSVESEVASFADINDTMTLTTIDGYPALLVEGVNVVLRNGLGNTNTDNGTGNLVLGYNELRTSGTNTRTGSHNIVLGRGQNYSGSSGIVAGFKNDYFADYGSILGGTDNEAHGLGSVVVGGYFNIAGNPSDPNDSLYSVVVSGYNNNSKGRAAAILAGQNNSTFADFSTVVAGNGNQTFGVRSVIVSGFSNQTNGPDSAILAGGINTLGTFGTNADGQAAAIVSGYRNGVTGTYAVTVGGYLNKSSNIYTVVTSGLQRDATGTGEWVSSNYIDSDWP